jgi:hypothetical protein
MIGSSLLFRNIFCVMDAKGGHRHHRHQVPGRVHIVNSLESFPKGQLQGVGTVSRTRSFQRQNRNHYPGIIKEHVVLPIFLVRDPYYWMQAAVPPQSVAGVGPHLADAQQQQQQANRNKNGKYCLRTGPKNCLLRLISSHYNPTPDQSV